MNPKTHCFLFVRYDLPVAQQIIQTNHSTHDMAFTLPQSADPVTPSIVLIGVPNQKSLLRVIEKLRLNQIEFSAFDEPDHDLGISSVATVPLDAEQRAILKNYKPWNEEDFLHARSSVGRAPSKSDGGPSFESGRATKGS